MKDSRIFINGVERDVAPDDLPRSRILRDAWVLNGDVVEVDLVTARAMANDVRRRWRAQKESEPFRHKRKKFACDPASLFRLQTEWGAALAVDSASPGTYRLDPGWRAIDGSYLGPMNFDGMRDLFLACSAHLKSAFEASLSKEADIASAKDAETLELIVEQMTAEISE